MSRPISLPQLHSNKMAILGESGVGKTCIAERFIHDHYSPYTSNTIGATFFTKTVNIDGNAIKLDIWDTAGQERYHSLAPMYYRATDAVIIVYDITNINSFNKAKFWFNEMKLNHKGNSDPIVYLVGNKADLEDNGRQVSTTMAVEYAGKNGMSFLEVSARDGTNIIELFHEIGFKLNEKEKTEKIKLDNVGGKVFEIKDEKPYLTCCS
jgi:small GTP-binding protein